MLHSTLAPEHSMTAYNGAAPAHGLAMALIWWPVAFVLAFTYLIVIVREYRGKVRPTEDTQPVLVKRKRFASSVEAIPVAATATAMP